MRKIKRNIQKLSSKKNEISLSVKKTAILAGVALAMSLSMGTASFALDPNTLPTNPIIIQNSEVTTATNNMNITTTGGLNSVGEVSFEDYSIGSSASVNYEFTAAGQASLSRVRGSNPSQIFGNITQSGVGGAVFLLNPNGILFGAGSQVNVDSFTATTMNGSYDPVTKTLSLSRGAATPQGIYIDTGANVTVTNNATFASNAIYSAGNISAGSGNVQFVTGDGVNFEYEINPANSNLKSKLIEESSITPADEEGLPGDVVYPNEIIGAQAIENRGGIITANNIQAMSVINAPIMAMELVNLSGVMTANAVAGEGGNVYVYAHNQDPVGATDSGLVSVGVGKTITATNIVEIESNKVTFGPLGSLHAGQIDLKPSTEDKDIHLGATTVTNAYNVSNTLLDKLYSPKVVIGHGLGSDVTGEINLKARTTDPIHLTFDTTGSVNITLDSTNSDSTLGITDANTITIVTAAGNTLKLGDVFKSAGAVDLTADTIIATNSAGIDIGGTFAIKKKTSATPVDFTASELNSLFNADVTYGDAVTIGEDGFTGDVSGTSLNFDNQDVTVFSTGDVNLSGISHSGTINVASDTNKASSVALAGDITSLGSIYSDNNVDLTVVNQPIFNGDIVANDINYTQSSGSFALTSDINDHLASTSKTFNIADTFSVGSGVVDSLDASFSITANDFTAGGNLSTGFGTIQLIDRNGISLTDALFNTYSTPYFEVKTLANNISIVDEISRMDQFVTLNSAAGIVSLIGSPNGSLSVSGTAELNMSANSLIDVYVGGTAPISATADIVKIKGINETNINIAGITAGGDVEVSSEKNLYVYYTDTSGDVTLTADSNDDSTSSLTIDGEVNGNIVTLNADSQLILESPASITGSFIIINQTSNVFDLTQDVTDKLSSSLIEVNAVDGISLTGITDAGAKSLVLSSTAFDYTTTPGSSLTTTGDLTLHQTSGGFALNSDLINAFVTDNLKLYSDIGTFTLGADLTVTDRSVALYAPTGAIDINDYTIDLGDGLLEAYANGAVELKLASEKVKAGCSSINIEGTGLLLDVQSLATNGDITVTGAGAVNVADINTEGDVSLTGTSLELGNVIAADISFKTDDYILDGTEVITPGTAGTLSLTRFTGNMDAEEAALLDRLAWDGTGGTIVFGDTLYTGNIAFNGNDYHSAKLNIITEGGVDIRNISNAGTITVDHNNPVYDPLHEALNILLSGSGLSFDRLYAVGTISVNDSNATGTLNAGVIHNNLDIYLTGANDIALTGAITSDGTHGRIAVSADGDFTSSGGAALTASDDITVNADSFSFGDNLTSNIISLIQNTGSLTLDPTLVGKLVSNEKNIYVNDGNITLSGAISDGSSKYYMEAKEFISTGTLATSGRVILIDKDGDVTLNNAYIDAFGTGQLYVEATDNASGSISLSEDVNISGSRNINLWAVGAFGTISTGTNYLNYGDSSLSLQANDDINVDVKGTGSLNALSFYGDVAIQGVDNDTLTINGVVANHGSINVASKGDLVFSSWVSGGNEITLTADSDNDGSNHMVLNDYVVGSQVTLNIDNGLTCTHPVTSNASDPVDQMITINSNADIVITNNDYTNYRIPISKLHSKNITFNNALPTSLQFTTYNVGETIDADSDILYVNTGIYNPRGPITAEHIYINADTLGLNSAMVNSMVSPITLTANNIRVLDNINISGKEYDLTATNLFDFASTGGSITTDQNITISAGIFDFTHGSLTATGTGKINLAQTSITQDFSFDPTKLTSSDITISSAKNLNLTNSIVGATGKYTLTANEFDPGIYSLGTSGDVVMHDILGDVALNDATIEAFGTGTLKLYADDATAGNMTLSENIAVTDRDLFLNAQGDILTGIYDINLGTGTLDLTAVGDVQARIASSKVKATGANIELVGTGPTLNVLSLTTTSSDVNISGNALTIANFAIDGNATISGTDVTTGTIATGGDTSVTGTGTVIVGDIDVVGDVLLRGNALTLNNVEGNNIGLYSNNFTMTGGKFITPGADASVVISDVAHTTAASTAHFVDVYNAIDNSNVVSLVSFGDDVYTGDFSVPALTLLTGTRVNTTGSVGIDLLTTGDYLFSVDRATIGVVDAQEANSIGIDGFTSSTTALKFGNLFAENMVNIGVNIPDSPYDFGGKVTFGEIFSRGSNFQLLSPVDVDFNGNVNVAGGFYSFVNGDVNLNADITGLLVFMYAGDSISPSGNVGDYNLNGNITATGSNIQILNNYGKLHTTGTITSNTAGVTLSSDGELIVDGVVTGHGACATDPNSSIILGSNAAIIVNSDLAGDLGVYVSSGSSALGDFILASTGSIATQGNIEIISEEDAIINGTLTANGTDSALTVSAKGNIETAGTITVAKVVSMTADSDATGDDHIAIGNLLTAGGPIIFNADSSFTNTGAITATSALTAPNDNLITINTDAFNPNAVISSKVTGGTNKIKVVKAVGDLDLSALTHPENLVADTLEFDTTTGSITSGNLVFTDLSNLVLNAGTSISSALGTSIGGFDSLDLTATGAIDINTGIIDSIVVNNASDLSIDGGVNAVTISTLPASISGNIDLSGGVITAPDITAGGHVDINGTSLALNDINAGAGITLTGNGSVVVGDISTTGNVNISDPISGITTGSITGASVNVSGTVVQVGDINASDDSSLIGSTSLEMANITGTGAIDLVLKSHLYSFAEPAQINVPDGTVYIADGLDQPSLLNVIDHVNSVYELVLGDNVCTDNVNLAGLNLSIPIRVSTKGSVNLTGLTGTELLTVDTLNASLADQASYVRLISAASGVFNVGDVKSNGDIVISAATGEVLNLGNIISNGTITFTSDLYLDSGEIRANAVSGVVNLLATTNTQDMNNANITDIINNVEQAHEIHIGKQHGYQGNVTIQGIDVLSTAVPVISVSTSGNVTLDGIVNAGQINVNNDDSGYNFCSEAKLVTLSGNISSLGTVYAAYDITVDNTASAGTFNINKIRTKKDINLSSTNSISLLEDGEIYGATDIGSDGISISSNGDIDLNGLVYSLKAANIASSGSISESATGSIRAYGDMFIAADGGTVTLNGITYGNQNLIVNASSDVSVGGTLYQRTTAGTLDITSGGDIVTTPYGEPDEGMIKSKNMVSLYAEGDINILVDSETYPNVDVIYAGGEVEIREPATLFSLMSMNSGNSFTPDQSTINNLENAASDSNSSSDTSQYDSQEDDSEIDGLDEITP